jgi:hypothetical protein
MRVSPSGPRGPRTPRRGRWCLVPALLVSVLLIPVAGAAPAAAASAPTAAPCPTTGGVPFSSQLTNGTVRIGRLARASGTTASACGLVTLDPVQGLVSTIARDNLTFEPFSLRIGLLSVPTQVTPVTDFHGTVVGNPDGTTSITLTGSLTATSRVLGFSCAIGPFTPTLTTGTSGSLTGSPLVGQLPGPLTGKLVANDFAVPAAQASLRCPRPVAGLVNLIVGLPQPAGGSSLTADISLTTS